jgi:4-diphosphocytidyl-2-C-methyl-D-erythritol kinase
MTRERVTVRAPAKINLNLAVGPRRDDGYHGLATIFHAVALFDDITVSRGEAGAGTRVILSGDQIEGVPTDGENLAVRALEMVAARYGEPADFLLQIRKSIPVAAGLAGGSADAAAALVATDAILGNQMSREDLHAMAASLGSDVPFALTGGTALGLGRGDRLTPVLARGSFLWVLAFAPSGRGLSTPSVYEELDRLRDGSKVPDPEVSEAMMQALRSGDPIALGAALSNDLQKAACSLRPILQQVLSIGEEYSALGSIVSGSGPTVAFLARDEEHALDLAVGLSASGVSGAVARVHGPVVGARIIEAG